MERENFGSRIGFLLISAGCAIGIGNIWRFPYVVGKYGGGIFVLIYIFFLIMLGIPVLTMEFSVGRAGKKSIVKAFDVLQRKDGKWHYLGKFLSLGNYVLMMFYTVVSGWMLYYFFSFLTGSMDGLDKGGVDTYLGGLMGSPDVMFFWTVVAIAIGMLICSLGLKKGVEKITKNMMVALLAILIILAVKSVFFSEGASEGVKFYLIPDFDKLSEIGIFEIISAAIGQAFFTLGLGIGSMMIFGSYIAKDRSLLGESLNIAVIDTFVAIIAGLIIFPACFSFGIEPDSGPSLVFETLPNVFNSMPLGRLWGTLFFLLMSFASLSTVIAVFENIIACTMDASGISRKKACLINLIIIILASLPCVLGFNVLSDFMPFGDGTNVLDLEDYVVSNVLVPLGSLVLVMFCTRKNGWGFESYLKECNSGKGIKMPRAVRFYCFYILPIIIFAIFVRGIFRL